MQRHRELSRLPSLPEWQLPEYYRSNFLASIRIHHPPTGPPYRLHARWHSDGVRFQLVANRRYSGRAYH